MNYYIYALIYVEPSPNLKDKVDLVMVDDLLDMWLDTGCELFVFFLRQKTFFYNCFDIFI